MQCAHSQMCSIKFACILKGGSCKIFKIRMHLLKIQENIFCCVFITWCTVYTLTTALCTVVCVWLLIVFCTSWQFGEDCANVLLLGMWESSVDEDMSVLHSIQSSRCQCRRCQQRSRMLTVSSSSLVMLPSDDAMWPWYLQTYVDRDSLQYLNEKHVINWCSGAYTLYPVKTTGIVGFLSNYSIWV